MQRVEVNGFPVCLCVLCRLITVSAVLVFHASTTQWVRLDTLPLELNKNHLAPKESRHLSQGYPMTHTIGLLFRRECPGVMMMPELNCNRQASPLLLKCVYRAFVGKDMYLSCGCVLALF